MWYIHLKCVLSIFVGLCPIPYIYLMKANLIIFLDKDIIPTTSEWLTKINQLFKWYGHDGDINKISMYK